MTTQILQEEVQKLLEKSRSVQSLSADRKVALVQRILDLPEKELLNVLRILQEETATFDEIAEKRKANEGQIVEGMAKVKQSAKKLQHGVLVFEEGQEQKRSDQVSDDLLKGLSKADAKKDKKLFGIF